MHNKTKIRRLHKIERVPIKTLARKYRLSKNTVKKIIRDEKVKPKYERQQQPMPKLGAYKEQLVELLTKESKLPKKQRRDAQQLFKTLQASGYTGAYDSVQRFVKRWKEKHAGKNSAYIPLLFDKGEAYQFDWSKETVELGGVIQQVSVGHFRLCHSRKFFVVAYLRETQEMLFDAHDRAFSFFNGLCKKGIYDNLTTAVSEIFVGKERKFNDHFLVLNE